MWGGTVTWLPDAEKKLLPLKVFSVFFPGVPRAGVPRVCFRHDENLQSLSRRSGR